jgi:hypothetical protein
MENPPTSFATDIRPLFRDIDVAHMRPMNVLLDDYAYMSEPQHARDVYEYLDGTKQPQMPPDGPFWNPEQLARFRDWMDGGYKP